MTDKITEPEAPEITDPVPFAKIAGDWTDDDAEVYEDDFRQADHGPEHATGLPHPTHRIKTVTRIVSARARLGTIATVIQEPVLLFPADPNRIKLIVYSEDNQDFSIGSDKTDVNNGGIMSLPIVTFNIQALDLSGHTGAVWVHSRENSACNVHGFAVTS